VYLRPHFLDDLTRYENSYKLAFHNIKWVCPSIL